MYTKYIDCIYYIQILYIFILLFYKTYFPGDVGYLDQPLVIPCTLRHGKS